MRNSLVLAFALFVAPGGVLNAQEKEFESPLDQSVATLSLMIEDYHNTGTSIVEEPSWQDVSSLQCPPEARAKYAQSIRTLANGWDRILLKAKSERPAHVDAAICHSKLRPHKQGLADLRQFASDVMRIETKADLGYAMSILAPVLIMRITQSMADMQYCYIDFGAGDTEATRPASVPQS